MKDKKNIKELKYKDTSEIFVPTRVVDQVIGQDEALNLIKKAASQKRHIILIGTPGTGKSMLASSLAEILPAYKLKDILSYPNKEDQHNPIIQVGNTGQGKKIVDKAKLQAVKENS